MVPVCQIILLLLSYFIVLSPVEVKTYDVLYLIAVNREGQCSIGSRDERYSDGIESSKRS